MENEDKIQLSDESEITVEDILVEGKKLFIKGSSAKTKKKSVYIEGIKLIGNEWNIKIFQYPEIKLTELEESSAIN